MPSQDPLASQFGEAPLLAAWKTGRGENPSTSAGDSCTADPEAGRARRPPRRLLPEQSGSWNHCDQGVTHAEETGQGDPESHPD